MNIFLTGATGFIGGRLAAKLIERGHRVTCLVRTPAKAGALKQLGATIAAGDINDRESLRAGMLGADVVFHMAAWYAIGVRDLRKMRTVNVDGTRNVFEVALEVGAPKIIYTSTVAVFGNTRGKIFDETHRAHIEDSVTNYDRSKWAAHYEVAEPMQKAGAPIIILQPGGVTGPGDTGPLFELYETYYQRLPALFGAKSGITWAHVDDVVEGHLLALEKGKLGEAYILAGPALMYKQAMQMWESISGVRAPRMWMPGRVAAILAGLSGLLERIGLRPLFSSEALREFVDVTYFARADKARRELGWQARPVEQLFKETLQWFMAQRENKK